VPAAIDQNSVSGDYEPSHFATGQILQSLGSNARGTRRCLRGWAQGGWAQSL